MTSEQATGRDDEVAAPEAVAGAPDWRPYAPALEADAASLSDIANALAAALDEERGILVEREIQRVRTNAPRSERYLAALLVLRDLIHAGWSLRCGAGSIEVRPHDVSGTPSKLAVRKQLLSGRSDQLAGPAARRFVNELERPPGGRDSILNLIADGRQLETSLRAIAKMPRSERTDALRSACRPYLTLAERGTRDRETGIDLYDIWRYFRHTWSSRYRRSPGRSLAFLVRDAAQPHHPVMGVAALSNAVVQLAPRDEWVGWSITALVEAIRNGDFTEDEVVRALRDRVRQDLAALYTDDLGFRADSPPLHSAEIERKLEELARSALTARQEGLRASGAERAYSLDPTALLALAKSPLFVAKRAATARSLLRANRSLSTLTVPLHDALDDPGLSWAIGFALRRLRQHFLSSAVMEISTCGAVFPYGHLLGGKLACLMMTSPAAARAYHERYYGEPSVIASQMAGRPIVKDATLALLGTSSLYSERSSQYNRVVLPEGTVSGQTSDVRYIEVGRSGGHGASNLSSEAEDALATMASGRNDFQNVNFMFGEGQSPKLRQIREGLDALGLGRADIIRHGSPRVVYVVPLATNARRFLLGIDGSAQSAFPAGDDGVEAIAEHWRSRWLASRLDHGPSLDALAAACPDDALVSREWNPAASAQRRLL